METWTILSELGEFLDEDEDPEQRTRPRLAGRSCNIQWLPADGHVSSYTTAGLEFKINDDGFKTIVEFPGKESFLHVTDRRVVLVVPDVGPEPGLVRQLGDALSLGTSETFRDLFRSVAGQVGLRDKYHLVAQIDYMCLGLIRFYPTSVWGTRSTLDLGALTGEPAPRVMEIVNTSLARKQDIAAVAESILARAQLAQANEDLRPLEESQRRGLADVRFNPNGDGFIALLAQSSIPLTRLADRPASSALSVYAARRQARKVHSLLLYHD